MKLLIIGFVWPEPESSAAGSRMMQLIETYKSNGYKITFVSAAARGEQAVDLPELGIEVATVEINNTSFDDFLKQVDPDVVMFDRFITEEQFGWRVAEQCPDAMRLLDTIDLQSLRKVRHECVRSDKEFTHERWLQSDLTKREIASILRCDLSLVISRFEMALLTETLKIDPILLHYLPFMLDSLANEAIDTLPVFEERYHFVTIGNFKHEPNLDSVRYLKQFIWPSIRKELPMAEMHIYGSYPSDKVWQLHDEQSGFLIKGWADDKAKVLSHARVCLAPLRFGAGLKGKFLDAICSRTPSITTTIGAEGYHGPFGGVVADSPEDIISNAVTLYTDKTLWLEKQRLGYELVEREFNKTELSKGLIKVMENTMKDLQTLRLNNFMGSMLQYHGMQSTKYMSKWIEEKNKGKVR